MREIDVIRQQLADERDVIQVLRSKDNHWRESNAKLIAELAAEREAVEDWKAELQEQAHETVRVAELLAAERESNDAQAAAYVRRINTLARAFESERHKREACEVLIRDLQKELAATSL